MPVLYSKLLVARFDTKNKCDVETGTVLTVCPRAKVPLKPHIEHHFVSADDRHTISRYGWVKKVKSFTLDDFIADHLNGDRLSGTEQEHLELMLAAIAQLPVNTPVAAEYSRRGSETRRMAFAIHRILYFKP